MTSAELAVRPHGALTVTPEQTDWTDDQKQALSAAGVTSDCTITEARIFLHRAQISGLDPFSGQIHLVGRWDSREGRKVFRPQTGIDGLRLIAFRTGNYGGQDDPLWCGPDGKWHDVWLGDEPPSAARVAVLTKDGGRFPAVALWSEYAQHGSNGNLTPMWKSMAANQLRKCAEALALRSAFPHDTAGLYIPEEMHRADDEAEAEFQRLTAEALRRKQYIGEERAVAQALAQDKPVERGAGDPDDDVWAEPIDSFTAQQKAVEDESGIPSTDLEDVSAVLLGIAACQTIAELNDARREAQHKHKAGRLDDPSWELVSRACSDRAAEIGATS